MVLEWWEFKEAAELASFKAGTIRQWRFRRRIPDAVRSTMSIYLGGSFQIVDFEPAAPRCGLTLAQQGRVGRGNFTPSPSRNRA